MDAYIDELYTKVEKLENIIWKKKDRLERKPNDIDLQNDVEYFTDKLKETKEELDRIEAEQYEREMRELNHYYWSTRI